MSLDYTTLLGVFGRISKVMQENRDYLIGLDQQNGDGDLGLSMDEGYRAVVACLQGTTETDLGKLFMQSAMAFNEAAPSSLGTITSLALMGMAKQLKGKQEADLAEVASALLCGVNRIMEKAKSNRGEKTILDSLCPAIDVLVASSASDAKSAFLSALEAAREGSQATRHMRSVHGRAAYYGDKSIGLLDGGAEVGRLIFEAIVLYLSEQQGS